MCYRKKSLKKTYRLTAVKIRKERKEKEKKDFRTHRNQMGISNQYKVNQRVANGLFNSKNRVIYKKQD
jgi:hypothetical protein